MSYSSTFAGLLLLLLACLIGEFWLLVLSDAAAALEERKKILLLFLKLAGTCGYWCRLGFILLYPLWLLLQPFPTGLSGRKAGFIRFFLALGLYLGSAWFLLKIYCFSFPLLLYPAAVAGLLFSGFQLAVQFVRRRQLPFGIVPDTRKRENACSFHFQTEDGYINVRNPFRGIYISGAAGAGKSESLAYPIIRQAVQKGYTGMVYDFKFPVLAEQLHAALWETGPGRLRLYLLNFHAPELSHRLNPLKASRLPLVAYAEEYSMALLHNLLPETIRKKDFWIRSAIALLTAVIWFLKKHHPACCSLPHAVNIILYQDYMRTMSMLERDAETAAMVRSVISAIENEAEGQIAGVLGSLQLSIGRLNSPEICWVLSGDDFEPDLNNPDDPKMLVIGTHPSLVDTFSPLISGIISVALKEMNQPGRLPSLLLLDEAPTLYIPGLEMIPATARSNRIATVFMAQDFSQLIDRYGKEKADVMLANLNNQFFGRTGMAASARMVSELFGKEEKEMESRSSSRSLSGERLSLQESVSHTKQEKQLIRPQDVSSLREGEFIGSTVEGKQAFFRGRVKLRRGQYAGRPIQPFAFNIGVQENFERVRREAAEIVTSYPLSLRRRKRG